MGGTGIIGTITGFASVCVNGLEVEFEDDTPVEIDGTPARPSDSAARQRVRLKDTRSQLSSQMASISWWQKPVPATSCSSTPSIPTPKAVEG